MSRSITASQGLFFTGGRSAFIPANPLGPTPPAPTVSNFSQNALNPSTALDIGISSPSMDTWTYELYSDAGLTHLVSSGTQPNFVSSVTAGSLTPAAQYWVRLKVTLSGVDSPWSATATATTHS